MTLDQIATKVKLDIIAQIAILLAVPVFGLISWLAWGWGTDKFQTVLANQQELAAEVSKIQAHDVLQQIQLNDHELKIQVDKVASDLIQGQTAKKIDSIDRQLDGIEQKVDATNQNIIKLSTSITRTRVGENDGN